MLRSDQEVEADTFSAIKRYQMLTVNCGQSDVVRYPSGVYTWSGETVKIAKKKSKNGEGLQGRCFCAPEEVKRPTAKKLHRLKY